jgi:hypothetical protein
MARAAAALVSQRSQSEMCTDYNMPISCCTSCMSDSNMLLLQIVCRFVPAQLRQMHASAAYPCCHRYPARGAATPGARQDRRYSGAAATVRAHGAGGKCPSGLTSAVASALQTAAARTSRRFGAQLGCWKLGCRTKSPTLMPSRVAAPPFSSSTANSGSGGPMISSDSGVARAAM